MNMCFNCGYMYADVDDNGVPISNEYCHCESDWPPCEEDEYVEEELREELGSMYDLGWDEEPIFEGYNAPYDYKEF